MSASSSIPTTRAATFAGQRVCVTGGAGFIGSHLVDALVELDAKVTVIDDLSNSSSERIAALMDGTDRDRVKFIYGSILDPNALAQALHDAETVFHLAAMVAVPLSIEEPERCFAVNATGTARVLEAARDAAALRVIYSASSSAYGDSTTLPLHEDLPTRPLSPYGASKAAGEHIVRAYAQTLGLPALSLRYFNVFGPRQREDSTYAAAIPSFIAAIRDHKPPRIFGDGTASRDFTHVSDIVRANLLAASTTDEHRGDVINIAAGHATTVNDLATTIAEFAGRTDITPEHLPARPGDIKHSYADISAANKLIGYAPLTDLETGIRHTAPAFGLHAATETLNG